jgi:hypothetical protein
MAMSTSQERRDAPADRGRLVRRILRIPSAARERVLARHPSGAKSRSKYYDDGHVVGEVLWEQDGRPVWGWRLRDGKKHGLSVEWWDNGAIAFVQPYAKGLQHGTARHWDDEGRLLLETRYVKGTGVDLWCDLYCRSLAEETHHRTGVAHGFRRRWNSDARSVYIEEHYSEGFPHGIFREWNDAGRLRRGFPRYFVHDKRVDRRAYLRAADTDESLPPWRRIDNEPRRPLPREFVGQPLHREQSRRKRSRRGRGNA